MSTAMQVKTRGTRLQLIVEYQMLRHGWTCDGGVHEPDLLCEVCRGLWRALARDIADTYFNKELS